jgi:hypothetical protein
VPAAVNLGPNFTYHEREVLPTTTRAGRKLLHHKACWVYRQACLAPERSVVVLSLYVVNSTRRFPNLPQNPLWQEARALPARLLAAPGESCAAWGVKRGTARAVSG